MRRGCSRKVNIETVENTIERRESNNQRKEREHKFARNERAEKSIESKILCMHVVHVTLGLRCSVIAEFIFTLGF